MSEIQAIEDILRSIYKWPKLYSFIISLYIIRTLIPVYETQRKRILAISVLIGIWVTFTTLTFV